MEEEKNVRLTLVCGDDDSKIDEEFKDVVVYGKCHECGDGIVYSKMSVNKILEMNPDKTFDDILLLCQECTQFKVLTTRMLTNDSVEVKALSEEQEKILKKLRDKLEKDHE